MNLWLFNPTSMDWGKMRPLFLVFWLITLSATAQATVIAKFDFEKSGGAVLDQGSQSEVNFTTSALIDKATGTGAMNQSNTHTQNRKRTTFSSSWVLSFSSNREGDAQKPGGQSGEHTWVSFDVIADKGKVFDFSNQTATVDTFVSSTLGGSTSANWTLYYSLDGGKSYSSLGTLAGASRSGKGSAGPINLTWDLSPIGNDIKSVDFILDPTSTGATNGVVNQRSTGFDNLTVNAKPWGVMPDVTPEPTAPATPKPTAQFTWTATDSNQVNTTIGKVPSGAFKAGYNGPIEPVKDNSLYVCRGNYKNSVHPGKLWKSWCHIGWGGKEVLLGKYDVMTTKGGKMQLVWVSSNSIPPLAVQGGYNDTSEGYGGYPLMVCHGPYKQGVHPGKLWKGNCNIGWGGKEITLTNYQILVIKANP
ncbi:MAG: DM9 repeat-containing protein [Candidatus Parabeggiatoa sp.]|nr:DM9 repeat-containing protein [Candidatus Parabeggiatoa sp.]